MTRHHCLSSHHNWRLPNKRMQPTARRARRGCYVPFAAKQLMNRERSPHRSITESHVLETSVRAPVISDQPPNVTNISTCPKPSKILNVAHPAELPVEQPPHFELVLNLKAAKAQGVTFSPAVLLRADRLIE
jgi:hypothetical protein